MDLHKAQRAEAARLVARREKAEHPSGLLPLDPDPALEEMADGWIDEERRLDIFKNGRRFITDILSPEQLDLRREREVQCGLAPDPAFYSGIYRRAYNPELGKRPKSVPHMKNDNPEFDSRIPSIQGGTGWTDIWMTRDSGAHTEPLTHGQRRRIRAAMRRVPAEQQRLARITLAIQFGVSPATIYRIVSS